LAGNLGVGFQPPGMPCSASGKKALKIGIKKKELRSQSHAGIKKKKKAGFLLIRRRGEKEEGTIEWTLVAGDPGEGKRGKGKRLVA